MAKAPPFPPKKGAAPGKPPAMSKKAPPTPTPPAPGGAPGGPPSGPGAPGMAFKKGGAVMPWKKGKKK